MLTIARSRRSRRSNGVGLLSRHWRRLYADASMGVPAHYSTPSETVYAPADSSEHVGNLRMLAERVDFEPTVDLVPGGSSSDTSNKEPSHDFSNQNEQYESCQYERQAGVTCGAACERQKPFSVSGFFFLGLLRQPLNSVLLFSFPVVALFHFLANSFYAIASKFRFGSLADHRISFLGRGLVCSRHCHGNHVVHDSDVDGDTLSPSFPIPDQIPRGAQQQPGCCALNQGSVLLPEDADPLLPSIRGQAGGAQASVPPGWGVPTRQCLSGGGGGGERWGRGGGVGGG